MQRIYYNVVTLTTGTPAAASSMPERATAMMVEPQVGNVAVSAVVEAASSTVIRQFPAVATVPVIFPFHHKSQNNQITPSDYKFKGATGDFMLVTFFEQ